MQDLLLVGNKEQPIPIHTLIVLFYFKLCLVGKIYRGVYA